VTFGDLFHSDFESGVQQNWRVENV